MPRQSRNPFTTLMGIRPGLDRGLRAAFTKKRITNQFIPKVDVKYREMMLNRFLSSNTNDGVGEPWRWLNPNYEKWKLENFGRLPILVRMGTLADSFTVAGHKDHQAWYRKGMVFLGSKHWKARRHEYGIDTNGVKRRLSGAPYSFQKDFAAEFHNYLGRQLKAHMLRSLRNETRRFRNMGGQAAVAAANAIPSVAEQGIDRDLLRGNL